MKMLVAAIVGIILAYLATHVLFVNSALSLIPWTIAGLIIGWWTENGKQSLINGAIYGFFLSFFFMVFGYQGTQSLLTRVLPFAVLGLFGAVCGLILGIIGSFARRKFEKK